MAVLRCNNIHTPWKLRCGNSEDMLFALFLHSGAAAMAAFEQKDLLIFCCQNNWQRCFCVWWFRVPTTTRSPLRPEVLKHAILMWFFKLTDRLVTILNSKLALLKTLSYVFYFFNIFILFLITNFIFVQEVYQIRFLYFTWFTLFLVSNIICGHGYETPGRSCICYLLL